MKMLFKIILVLSVFVSVELRMLNNRFIKSRAYSQCGGLEWTGSTTCPDGFYCFYQNPWLIKRYFRYGIF